MNISSETKFGLGGAVIGAFVAVLVGFLFLGWTPAGTVESEKDQAASAAVRTMLTSICVSQFQSEPDFEAKLEELKAASLSNRRVLIENGGWATIPGFDSPSFGIASECAGQLISGEEA